MNSSAHGQSSARSATPKPGIPASPQRLAFLDGLRALAALAVVIYHITGSISQSLIAIYSYVFDLGRFGVVLFFLCSGFIIPLSLQRANSLRQFWVRRFFRLYPLYWLSLLFWLIAVYVLQLGQFQGQSITNQPTQTILANITMIQGVLGFDNLVPLYWTLTLEMVFYGVISVLFITGLLQHTVRIAYTFIIAAMMLEGLLPLLLGIRFVSGLNYLGTMFVGTVLYRYTAGDIAYQTARNVVGAALGMEIILLSKAQSIAVLYQNLNLLTAYGTAYLVFLLTLKQRGWQPNRFGRYLGVTSYSLYLMHTIVLVLLPSTSIVLVDIVVALGCTLLLSAVTYRLIEQPAIALGRYLSQPTRIAGVANGCKGKPVALPPRIIAL